MNIADFLIYVLIFPGFLFLVSFGMFLEWADRKLMAKFQNRVGPPWFQPLADFVKLFAKEDTVPAKADKFMFSMAPVLALTAALTTVVFLPILRQPLFSFPGDIVVLAYLLTIPTFMIFLGGWYSVSYFASIGAMRAMLLLYSYEVPLLMSLMGPAILAGTWNIMDIVAFQASHPWVVVYQPIGFVVILIALVGKLERIPFDIPEAETEIVEGPLCEYSGKKLAFYRLMFDVEMVIGAAMISVFYLGGFSGPNVFWSVISFVLKTSFILLIVSLVKAVLGRVRIDQMVDFCWKYLVPAAVVQYLIIIITKIWF